MITITLSVEQASLLLNTLKYAQSAGIECQGEEIFRSFVLQMEGAHSSLHDFQITKSHAQTIEWLLNNIIDSTRSATDKKDPTYLILCDILTEVSDKLTIHDILKDEQVVSLLAKWGEDCLTPVQDYKRKELTGKLSVVS